MSIERLCKSCGRFTAQKQCGFCGSSIQKEQAMEKKKEKEVDNTAESDPYHKAMTHAVQILDREAKYALTYLPNNKIRRKVVNVLATIKLNYMKLIDINHEEQLALMELELQEVRDKADKVIEELKNEK